MKETIVTEETQARPTRFPIHTPTLRELVAVIFRHKVLIVSSFVAIFFGVVVVTYSLPKRFQTHTKILIKRERADPVMTPANNAQSFIAQDVTQEDLNSEVELLKSRDLLEKVVQTCGLHTTRSTAITDRIAEFLLSYGGEARGEEMRIPRAVRRLERKLEVEPIAKSKMIEVRYESEDPRLAARVLETLSQLYLEKHLAVHRPAGALDFFEQQTTQYMKGLENAEQHLAQFSRDEGVVSIELEKDITLRKLSDFESLLREGQAQQAAVAERLKSLEAQAKATPERVTTQVRSSDNPFLLQQMKSTILGLELKRTELLAKYEPGHRSVQEVETQLVQARAALIQAETNLLRDETSDLAKTRIWLDEELARTRAELATVRARVSELARNVDEYQGRARQINRKEIAHQDLARAAKTAEENYLLYQRKQEEARISEALDRRRIINAAVAEAATVPAFPSSPNWSLNIILGLILAFVLSLGMAFTAEYLDATFRTPDEVEEYLGVTVIASVPRA